ncbi:MAG: mechanosensitive ion channel [Saprospiraceae bacterium]|nr:mechanosensitive ion channel [Saprospiraceae bacterium]
MDNLDTASFQRYLTQFMDWAVTFVPKIILAGLVLWIGFKIIKKLDLIVDKSLEKANIGLEITGFLSSILGMVMKVVVVMIAASFVGFEVSSLLGVLAAAGFAVGLALQGFLGNFASGLTIIFFKPYKVGDWVQISDMFGKVKNIQIFNTTLETPGDKTLIIPNGQVTDNIITNFSTKGKIRIELNVTMPYEESFPKVEKILREALSTCDHVMNEPEPLIGIESYDSHNIILAIRPYIDPDQYWDATFEVYRSIKSAFNKNGIRAAYSEGVELGPIGD